MNPLFEFLQKNRLLAQIEKAKSYKQPSLDVDDFDLLTFPFGLTECTELRSLNVSHNRISSLIREVSELRLLQNLSLEYNCITEFPKVLTELSLKTLNISHNPIKDLTNSIGSLTSLEVLWCNGCCLTTLPEELGNLNKLYTFGARHNKIMKLPDSIVNMQDLRWLTLEDNHLHTVPKDFGKLKNLVHLNFNRNNFSHIPMDLSQLEKLKVLLLQRNEFFNIQESVLANMTHVTVNLLHNPLMSPTDIDKTFPNVIITEKETEPVQQDTASDTDSNSSDDWLNSVETSDLVYSVTDTDSSDDDEFDLMTELPGLSKFLVFY